MENKWEDDVVYKIYCRDNLEELPILILNQMKNYISKVIYNKAYKTTSEEFSVLKEKIKETEKELIKDRQRLQKICPHKNIIHSRGYTEYQGYDRDYVNGSAECKDCGLYGFEDSNTYNKLIKIKYNF